MYHFNDEKTNNIKKKYNISPFYIVFDKKDEAELRKGLRELSNHTIDILKKISILDETEILLYYEAHRFLVDCVKYQRRPQFYGYDDYYKDILNYFHSQGFLKYKKKIAPYKEYRNKTPICVFHFRDCNEDYEFKYNSAKDMILDYGRYKTDKILSLSREGKRIEIDCIRTLLDFS